MRSHTNTYHRLRPLPGEGNDQEISRQLLRKTSSKMWRWSPELDWLVHMTCKRNGKVHNCLSERKQPPPPPHPTGTLIHWCMATAELGRNLQISRLVPGVWSMRLWVFLLTATHQVAGSGRGQDEANPVFWLAFWAGKMDLSYPLGISRFGPVRKVLLDMW